MRENKEDKASDPSLPTEFAGVRVGARLCRLFCSSKGCRLAFLFWRKRPILEELGSSCLVLPTEGRFLCLQPVEEEAAENDRSFFNSSL